MTCLVCSSFAFVVVVVVIVKRLEPEARRCKKKKKWIKKTVHINQSMWTTTSVTSYDLRDQPNDVSSQSVSPTVQHLPSSTEQQPTNSKCFMVPTAYSRPVQELLLCKDNHRVTSWPNLGSRLKQLRNSDTYAEVRISIDSSSGFTPRRRL